MAKRHSKRYLEAKKLIDRTKIYEIEEAINILKKMPQPRFDQTVELTINLGINPKKSDQMVRGAVSLPHGIGKTRKVIVFATGEEARLAREAGADEVGGEELIKKIQDGWLDFDIAIAPPYMMKSVSKIGKILGPQGKMPSPKNGTVTDNITQAVKEFKAGKVEFRSDSGGVVHTIVGKLSFSVQAIKENIETFIEYLKLNKPPGAKGAFIRKVFLSASMSPSIPIKI